MENMNFENVGAAENNEIVVSVNDLAPVDLIDQLKNPMGQIYSSLKDDGTRQSKIDLFNAINASDKPLAEKIGEVLEIVDVVAHPIELTDEITRQKFTTVRTILIDKDGNAYSAVSQGVTSALSKIFSIVGMPDNNAWYDEPVKMKIKQVKTRNGNNKVNTIELV